MTRAGPMHGHRSRRGSLLLEVLIALALFLGAGAFAIGATRNAIRAVDRAGRASIAVDLARTKMAELEAGLVTIAELREAALGIERVGSVEAFGAAARRGGPPISRWVLDIETERTEFTGLTLVTLTVREEPDAGPGTVPDEDLVSFTLRQLVRFRDDERDGFEQDRMLERRR